VDDDAVADEGILDAHAWTNIAIAADLAGGADNGVGRNDRSAADGSAWADDRSGFDDRAGLDMRRGIDMSLRRDPGFAGHRSRSGRHREQQPADHGESLLRSRMDQNRDAGRRLGGEFGGTQHGRRLQRLHQREISLAVDEDERTLAAFTGWRQGVDRYVGKVGID
jgi:hypothetical protein